MTELSSNLKLLMEAAHINPSELARRTGVAQPIIHRLSTGQNTNPKLATIKPIAHYFTVTVSQLIGEVALPETISVTTHEGEAALNRVPLISWRDAPNWPSLQSHFQGINNATYVSTDADVSEKAYSLMVEGTKMGPLFPDGTMLIFEPNRQPSDQDFVLVQLAGDIEARLKQVLTDGTQQYLKAVTPEDLETGTIPLQDATKFLGVMAQAKVDY